MCKSVYVFACLSVNVVSEFVISNGILLFEQILD